MKRLHVHVAVEDLAKSIGFYRTLFAVEPTVHRLHLLRQPGRRHRRALTDTFSGIRPVDLPGFIAAQVAGALCGMALLAWLLREPTGQVVLLNPPLDPEAQL